MGSKRHIDPHQQTTDKRRTDDEHIHEEDKQLLQTKRGKLAIPEGGENPALSDLKKRREEQD